MLQEPNVKEKEFVFRRHRGDPGKNVKAISVNIPITVKNFDYNPRDGEEFVFILQLSGGRLVSLATTERGAFFTPSFKPRRIKPLSTQTFENSYTFIVDNIEEKPRTLLVFRGYKFHGFLPIAKGFIP